MAFIFLFLFALFSTRLANAERKLPADIQVDLVFPRNNETYSPTQVFPIVFAISNLDAVWPIAIQIKAEVRNLGLPLSMKDRPFWASQYTTLSPIEIEMALNESSTNQIFHFEPFNITNGTSDLFDIRWDVSIAHECIANNTNPTLDDGKLRWKNDHDGSESRYIEFRTAPGAQLPDIQAIVNSCPERDQDNTAVVRVTEMRTTYYDHDPCPVLNTTVTPDKCLFKSAAKELSANVSTAMLNRLGCDEGDWRTMTVPCLAKEKSMALPRSPGSSVGWALLTLAFAAVSDVL